MFRIDRKRLAIAASILLISATGIIGISSLAQFTLSRMLSRDAMLTANLWARTELKNGLDAAGAGLSRNFQGPFADRLVTAHIDRIATVSADGGLKAFGPGAPDLEKELGRLAASVGGLGANPFDIESGAYSLDTIRWFGPKDFRSWVLFPPLGGTERLAVRVDQTETAAAITTSFVREIVFSFGVAVITFLSFMAGYSYRQRQIAAENAANRYLARHDELTGLPNRKQFEEFTTAAINGARQKGGKSALFALDLDGFKAVNDTLGHAIGDGLLRAAAKRLKASLRGDDLLARLSGDEFAIVVPDVADTDMLTPLADRILQLLSAPFRVDGHEIQVSCSIGLAVAPENGADLDSLMRNADFALYRAKSEGRRTWRFFDPEMAQDLASRRTTEDGLREALERNEFKLLYQPQVELATGRTVGYEAMLRWDAGGRGLLSAASFLSVAEETGLVVPIGEWVVRQVAEDCTRIPEDRTVSINISSTQLKRDGMENFIADTLREHGVEAARIAIEVNESILGRNEAETLDRLEKIRASGIRTVMDSFGVGTLSLGLLARCSFDKVKVDRSFLLNDEGKSGAVLAAICSLGRSLGFRVAGQGVETLEHAQMLRLAGCSEAQGYHFAPPMPIEDLLQMEAEMQSPKLAAYA